MEIRIDGRSHLLFAYFLCLHFYGANNPSSIICMCCTRTNDFYKYGRAVNFVEKLLPIECVPKLLLSHTQNGYKRKQIIKPKLCILNSSTPPFKRKP